jgi:hypothetical protein
MMLCKKDPLVPPWQYIHISFILNYGKVSYFFLREKNYLETRQTKRCTPFTTVLYGTLLLILKARLAEAFEASGPFAFFEPLDDLTSSSLVPSSKTSSITHSYVSECKSISPDKP